MWATHYAETAVVSTVYELWPILFIVGLARSDARDEAFRLRHPITKQQRSHLRLDQIMLVFLAAIGLIFMMGSQIGRTEFELLPRISYANIVGILLALLAAALGATDVLATITFGRVQYYHVASRGGLAGNDDDKGVADRSQADRRLLLWLTLLGYAVSRFAVLPFAAVGTLISAGFRPAFNVMALLGSVALRCGNGPWNGFLSRGRYPLKEPRHKCTLSTISRHRSPSFGARGYFVTSL